MERESYTDKPQSSGWDIALSKAAAGEDKLYLGDPEAIRTILQNFAAAVSERQVKVLDGEMHRDAAAEKDREACYVLTDIFLGGSPNYETVGDWNSEQPDQIAGHVGSVFNIETEGHDPREVVATAFGLHLGKLYDAIQSAANGEEDEVWQAALDADMDLMVSALIGMHWPGAYEGEEHPAA